MEPLSRRKLVFLSKLDLFRSYKLTIFQIPVPAALKA